MESYLGQIGMFAYTQNREIHGWMICDGRTLAIEDNPALFSLLGTKYGGDGTHTFAIPDLREATAAGNIEYQICVTGAYPAFQ